MKELKPGQQPEKQAAEQKARWDGKKATCNTCKGEFQLESTDKPHDVQIERSPSGRWNAQFKCPTVVGDFRCTGLLHVEGRNNEP